MTTQQSTFDTSSWKRLTKKDQRSIFYRLGFLLASFNYERMQNIGFGYIMIPAIRRLYPDDKVEQAAAMQRHLEFFNTHPYMAAPIVGVTMALEEERANGAEVDNAAISGVKVGMLGPLAGVGDPVFWGTLRPILGALAASFAANGSWIGPILFFVVWNVMRLLVLWYGEQIGYQQGKNITQNLAGGIMQDVTLGASVLGMFIMGVLVPRWTTIYFPLVVSRVKNPDTGKTVTTTLDQIVNGQLLSGLAALLLTMGVLWLLKRRVNPLAIIFGLFVIGIIGRMLGILGLQA
ncbi:PTS system mannose/fructose/sorbose family transporter subunit IID [Leuconostoc fallax]|nr:PTS system mannose/fructose/sorbose family transporter subunit IID [Leuconostoc fallax]